MIYVFIKETGEISHCMKPGWRDQLEDRSYHNGCLMVTTEEDVPMEDILDLRYWDFGSNEFKDRDRRPSNFHYWKDSSWALDQDKLINHLKAIRTSKLYECDWTQLPDSPLTPVQKELWALYRSKLRDLDFTNEHHLEGVKWPIAPGEVL